MEEDVVSLERETTSSIELARDAKGVYRWTAKRYYDGEDQAAKDIAVADLEHIDQEMRKRFCPADVPLTQEQKDSLPF